MNVIWRGASVGNALTFLPLKECIILNEELQKTSVHASEFGIKKYKCVVV